jgi:hypothetical protein
LQYDLRRCPSPVQRQHAQQQPLQQPLRLSVDEFERAIELLEKAHNDAVKAWWDEDQAGECWNWRLEALQLHIIAARLPSLQGCWFAALRVWS